MPWIDSKQRPSDVICQHVERQRRYRQPSRVRPSWATPVRRSPVVACHPRGGRTRRSRTEHRRVRVWRGSEWGSGTGAGVAGVDGGAATAAGGGDPQVCGGWRVNWDYDHAHQGRWDDCSVGLLALCIFTLGNKKQEAEMIHILLERKLSRV